MINAVKCNYCGAVIESKHRHDFQSHSCSKAYFFIDGGPDGYWRAGGNFDAFTRLKERPSTPQYNPMAAFMVGDRK